jgi:ribose transport system permease protein
MHECRWEDRLANAGPHTAQPTATDGQAELAPGQPDAFYQDTETFFARALRFLSFRNISAAYVLGGFIVLFSIWIPDTFLTNATLQTILNENAVAAILAVGLVAPLAAGAFDISIGATMALSVCVLGVLVSDHQISPWIGILLTILTGAACGSMNGLLVVKGRMDSIIVTLAAMAIFTGLAVAVGNNRVFINFPDSFLDLSGVEFLGLSLPLWALIGIALLASYFLDLTAIGRSVYATGGGLEAARLAGVRTGACVFFALVASATIAGMAAVVAVARVGAAQSDLGPPYLLPAFAAVFLGSTQFKNGRFNVWGTVLATYTLAVGVAGFTQAGGPIWLPDVFNGVALLLAVGMTVRRRTLRPKLRRSGERTMRAGVEPGADPSASSEQPAAHPALNPPEVRQ